MRRRALAVRPGIDPRTDEVATRLSALADPVRLRLLGLLARGDCPVGGLASALGLGQSLVSFHVAALRDAGLVGTERVGRFTYARLQHGSLRGLLSDVADLISLADHPRDPGGSHMRNVVFGCVHNAGRSQMAASLFNRSAPPGWRAVSAGTRPADHVHPRVVDVMAEIGVDLSTAQPRLLTPEMAEEAELLVTMGCGEECPNVPVPRQDWPVADPAGRPLDEVRAIRDELRDRVTALVVELHDTPDTDLDDDEQAAVHPAIDQLHTRFLRLLGRERVERVVEEEVRRFRSASVRTFMDILVCRHARERLRAMAQAEGRVAKVVPDPAGKPLDEVRAIRGALQAHVEDLIASLVAEPAPATPR